jgi:5-(carboxyamino)imidazole ribonucleotide synthase
MKDIQDIKIGLIGGGQLGKMILSEANRMNLKTLVLDSNKNSPCKNLCNNFYIGKLDNYNDILKFGKRCDIITFEIEHINIDALLKLEHIGKKVYPKPHTLSIVQDKSKQKKFYNENNLPTSKYSYYKNLNDLFLNIKNGIIQFPSVWKKTKLGYDGFGVKVLRSEKDTLDLPDCEMIIEEFVPFKKELAVIVARNFNGEIKTYETVEMEFNSFSNQVEYVISPSKISEELNKKAINIAIEATKKLDVIGLLAVEMFLTDDDDLIINEVAPRPHNSGHFTIEACPTSQFEQHLRSILNLALGNTNHDGCAIMLNLVGGEGFEGNVRYENLNEIFSEENTHLHIYGKEKTRPNRKMGHITIICDKFDDAYKKAKSLKEKIKVKAI